MPSVRVHMLNGTATFTQSRTYETYAKGDVTHA